MQVIPVIVSIGSVINDSAVFAIQQFFTAIMNFVNVMTNAFPFIPPEVFYITIVGVLVVLSIKFLIFIFQAIGGIL